MAICASCEKEADETHLGLCEECLRKIAYSTSDANKTGSKN